MLAIAYEHSHHECYGNPLQSCHSVLWHYHPAGWNLPPTACIPKCTVIVSSRSLYFAAVMVSSKISRLGTPGNETPNHHRSASIPVHRDHILAFIMGVLGIPHSNPSIMKQQTELGFNSKDDSWCWNFSYRSENYWSMRRRVHSNIWAQGGGTQ